MQDYIAGALAARDAGREQIRVREQVRGHERAVGVAADGDAAPLHVRARLFDRTVVEGEDVTRT